MTPAHRSLVGVPNTLGRVGRVTLQTIADQVGVSRMTVSNAFSRPDQLSSSLREKILEAAQKLGYVGPDPAARALARGTTGAIGILLTPGSLEYSFRDDVATGFLGAVAHELTPTGLSLTLLTASTDGDLVPAAQVRDQSVIMILSTHGLDRRVGETLQAFLEGGGGLFIAAGQDKAGATGNSAPAGDAIHRIAPKAEDVYYLVNTFNFPFRQYFLHP